MEIRVKMSPFFARVFHQSSGADTGGDKGD